MQTAHGEPSPSPPRALSVQLVGDFTHREESPINFMALGEAMPVQGIETFGRLEVEQ